MNPMENNCQANVHENPESDLTTPKNPLMNRPVGESGSAAPKQHDLGAKLTGTEPVFGGFTNTATIISNIRLTHNGQIFAAVNDLGASITTLARDFRHHADAVRAYQEIIRLRSLFDNRVQLWKNEEAIRLQKKRSMNGNQLRDLEKELNRVRLDIARGVSTLNKLQNDLDLISRVGSECPLLKPQSQSDLQEESEYRPPVFRRKKAPNVAVSSLAKYLRPNGLKLDFRQASFPDEFDDTIREHLYDLGNSIAFLAHWSDRNPHNRERGCINLHLILLPRSIAAMQQLPDVFSKHRFWIEEHGRKHPLEFREASIADEKTLMEKKLIDYLHDTEATYFQHRDLVIRKPLTFHVAEFTPEIPIEKGRQIPFFLKAARRPDGHDKSP